MRLFLSLLLCIATFSLAAQRPTTTTTKTHRTTASNVHTNNGKVDSHSSTSHTRYSYKFSADFKDYKQQGIKEVLMSHLNDQDLTLKNDSYTWQLENAGGTYFTCKLSDGTLSLNFDKTIAPSGSLNKMEALCDDLVSVISSHPSTQQYSFDPQLSPPKNTGSNKAELQQALRELEAARRKVERLGKKVDDGREN